MRVVLFLFAFLPFACFAQITITQSDMPAIDDIVTRSIADTFIQVNPAPTGTNFTWDYSNLNAIASNADTFQSLSSAPGAFTFFFLGAANRAVSLGVEQDLGQLQLSDGYQFYNVTSSGFFDAGFAGSVNGIPIPARYDQPDRIFAFPMDYTDTFSSSSVIDITIPNLVSYVREVDRFTEVDGWGTLYLPGDTLQVLRVKSTIDEKDSIDIQGSPFPIAIPRQVTEYKWLAKGEMWPVLTIREINVFGAGITTQVSYKNGNAFPVGITPVHAAGWQLYPNRVQSGYALQLTGTMENEVNVRWINVAGQVVATQQINTPTFSAPALPVGQYWVQLWDDRQMKVVPVQLY